MWQVLSSPSATVWSKAPKRDFIFADDAAEAIMALCKTDHVGPVNLGTGVATSVGRLTEIITALSGVPIHDQKIAVSGHMEFRQDISLLKKLIAWEPRHSLEDGLAITFNQMKKYYQEFGLPKE
jgi:UDP-glucose 4-epimerase